MVFNPGPDETFNAGDAIVVIGKKSRDAANVRSYLLISLPRSCDEVAVPGWSLSFPVSSQVISILCLTEC